MNRPIQKITAIGLGPGDPDLITIKGLKALQDADVIFYPATSITPEGVKSFALPILKHLGVAAKAQPLLLPMNASQRVTYYHEAYSQIKASYDSGSCIAVVSEGDILFYSTFAYLLMLSKEDELPIELIPGIPAFVHGASVMSLPLVLGGDSFSVVALPKSFDEIAARLANNQALVVMKPKVLNPWCDFLKSCDRPFFYAEYLGTEKQWTTNCINELQDREIPYFAVFIFPSQYESI